MACRTRACTLRRARARVRCTFQTCAGHTLRFGFNGPRLILPWLMPQQFCHKAFAPRPKRQNRSCSPCVCPCVLANSARQSPARERSWTAVCAVRERTTRCKALTFAENLLLLPHARFRLFDSELFARIETTYVGRSFVCLLDRAMVRVAYDSAQTGTCC